MGSRGKTLGSRTSIQDQFGVAENISDHFGVAKRKGLGTAVVGLLSKERYIEEYRPGWPRYTQVGNGGWWVVSGGLPNSSGTPAVVSLPANIMSPTLQLKPVSR